jgi:hypothetical protein
MTEGKESVAPRVFEGLAKLAAASDENATELACLRLDLGDGTYLDVYKAEQNPGPVTLWRVRGFHHTSMDPGTGDADRTAVILGTRDNRALLTWPGRPLDAGGTMGGTPIVGATETTRPLDDLAKVIAERLRPPEDVN